LAHGFGGFSIWLLASLGHTSWHVAQDSCSLHRGWEAGIRWGQGHNILQGPVSCDLLAPAGPLLLKFVKLPRKVPPPEDLGFDT
jgi:hypothetical protein